VKTPSFFEIKTIVEYVQEQLESAQLQEVFCTDEGLILGFYRYEKNPRMNYLIFDLDKPFPFMALLEDNPWLKFKKTKPIGLFLSSHAKNTYFSQIEVIESLGRVLRIQLAVGDNKTEIEFRAIPKQVNLIVKNAKKSISWFPVKPLGEHDQTYNIRDNAEEVRSVFYLIKQWRNKRAAFASDSESVKGGTLSPFEKWIKNRKKDLEKKQKALVAITKQVEDFQNEEWSNVGEYLKNNGLKKLPPEWSIYVDFEKSVTQNMQRCFEKSKAAKSKISGSQRRLAALNQEVEDLSDLTESKFEKFQQNLVKKTKQKQATERKVEGRLRKMELSDEGAVAYMGKSAADNMNLLRTSKPFDLWLHLKDYPSAHAVVHKAKNANLSDSSLVKVCKWLLEEGLSKSQIQMGGKYSVVMVECRHVKPLKGDKLGRVTYHNAREILIAL
jgi:predicted ribosome quality control (RQC) complex YloA/Tae2 family protein